MRATLERDGGRREPRALEAGRVALTCINTDDNVDGPLAPPTRTSQKLIASVALLRAMPEPSTTEGRNLRLETQTLIEQAAVQQARSSASRLHHSSAARGSGSARDGTPSVHAPRRNTGA